MENSRFEIVLIGPIRAGKSTIGRLLAERLGVPQVSLDGICWDYYRELDFGNQKQHGPDGMIAERFRLHAVLRTLEDHHGCVFDLGAGHSVYREPEALENLRGLLAPFPNVFLLLPSPDMRRAAQILEARNTENDWLQRFRIEQGYDPNQHFLLHESNLMLAKKVIYTDRETPDETAARILTLLRSKMVTL